MPHLHLSAGAQPAARRAANGRAHPPVHPAHAVLRGLLLCGLLVAAALPARAADDSLYRAFGQKPGIAALMLDFSARLKADARIGHFFKETKPSVLAEQLTDQVCQLSGGPCTYEGAPMDKAHQDLEIRRADFNRLVELLQDAMGARGISFADQNRLLALLAPMHRQIVTR